MRSKVLVPLARGFEEIEAMTIIDVLRRAEITVMTVSIDGNELVCGAHGIDVVADADISSQSPLGFDAVVLPGGMPGSTNLLESEALALFLSSVDKTKGLLAAICAAPKVLAAHGFLENKKATCHFGVESEMANAVLSREAVVCDERRITSRGVGTALDFALAIVSYFKGDQLVQDLRHAMIAEKKRV